MTNKEEVISNISYTNSDFRTIFPQLLDTAKKLTNKWDPSLSNESDPGNILIKEAAIVGDKNNYHVDKNVLECFPLSATQQSSARQIYDLVGYNMHWYRSALADIRFTLLNSLTDINANLTNIKVPAGTQVSDASGEYVYTTLEDLYLETAKEQKIVEAIQGQIVPYDINGNDCITVSNLDENMRLYFPQNVVAENAIYVFDYSKNQVITKYSNSITPEANYWGLVDNLAQYPSGSKVFKFGLDLDSDNCYIEFPEYIVTNIGNGLRVFYTTTLGNSGNIKNEVINKFVSPFTESINGEDIDLEPYISINNNASLGGEDPESLREAYRNYKKLIGTYDTLVSRRDYQNAIFNLEDNGLPLVSNDFITDRTSDQNFSYKVMVNNGDKSYAKNVVKLNSITSEPYMRSYDIIMYLLKQPDALNTIEDYNNSFIPDLSANTKSAIESEENGIGEIKAIQHNISYINQFNDVDTFFSINNILTLTGNLITYYKVSKKEAKEIETNVTRAIINAYNSRELDFGEEIDYNSLIELIKNADDRILNINLSLPQYVPNKQSIDSTLTSLYSANNSNNNEIIARMVLAGNVQLFNFQDEFQYDFGQTAGNITDHISTISTENSKTLTTNTATVLDKNDIIQIITPSLNITKRYSSTVKYTYNDTDLVSSGDIYQLENNLDVIYYNNETGLNVSDVIAAGSIIRPQGFDLQPSVDEKTLRAGQSIEVLEFAQLSLPQNTNYYVVSNAKDLINNQYHITIPANNGEYILKQDEYLMYLNNTNTGLIVLGSGTSLINPSNQAVTLESPITSLDEIYSTSADDIINYWELLPSELIVRENQIVTLTEGDQFQLNATGTASSFTLDQDIRVINGFDVQYKFIEDDNIYSIKDLDIAGYYIKGRCDLELSANSKIAQTLTGNQVLIINGKRAGVQGTYTISNQSILFNYPINTFGGAGLDVRVLNEETGSYESKLSCYSFTQTLAGTSGSSDLERNVTTKELTLSNISDTTSTLNFTFNRTNNYTKYMISIKGTLQPHKTLTIKSTALGVNQDLHFSKGLAESAQDTVEYGSSASTDVEVIDDVLVISSSNTDDQESIVFEFNSTDSSTPSTITLGYIYQQDGLNTNEIDSKTIVNGEVLNYSIETEYSNVIAKIADILSYDPSISFDWLYQVPSTSKVIQPLLGESYFNPNHIYNECTIAKIDLNASQIKVNASSIQQ